MIYFEIELCRYNMIYVSNMCVDGLFCVLTFGFPSCRGVERACLCCSTCFLGAFLRRRALSSSHLKISGVWGMIMGNDMGVGRCSRFSFSVFSAADRPVPSVLSLDSRGFFYYIIIRAVCL